MAEATSRCGRPIKPSFKRKAAELGETTPNPEKNVSRKRKKQITKDSSPTPTPSPGPDDARPVSSDVVAISLNTPQVTNSTPSAPVIDLVDLEDSVMEVCLKDDEAKLGEFHVV